jgi:DNA-binding NarL/FixJ family response regulator
MTILVVDDHPLFNLGLTTALTVAAGHAGNAPALSVRSATSLVQALAVAAEFAPELVLVDFHMPQHDGLQALQVFASKFPLVSRLVISGDERAEVAALARAHGAKGLISKALPIDQILQVIRIVGAGHEWWHERHGGSPMPCLGLAGFTGVQPRAMFTLRQLEVLRLLGSGLNNREIADALHIAERTVKQHMSDMLDKAAARNRVQLLSLARSQGLLA